MRIVLGSQSKWRRKLLEDAGVVFECMAADIDEKAVNVHEGGSCLSVPDLCSVFQPKSQNHPTLHEKCGKMWKY